MGERPSRRVLFSRRKERSGMKETVKTCPFCGCSVSVERVPLEHYQGCVIFEIKCLNCGCRRTLTKNDSVYRTEEEARANAIAQWNERPSTADVPQEMSAVEYTAAREKMCDSFYPCDEGCPIWDFMRKRGESSCPDFEVSHPFDFIAIVEKWAREHPEDTE